MRSSINVLANVYEGLVSTDVSGRIVPALAESWEVADEGKTWKFKLRAGAVFFLPTGLPEAAQVPARPVVARDVVYSLNRAVFGKGSLYGWLLGGLLADGGSLDFEGGKWHPDIRAVNERTVEIRLSRSFPLLNRLVTVGGWVYPEGAAGGGDRNLLGRGTFGSGPFQLKVFVPDDRIELIRAQKWWGEAKAGAPGAVTIRVMSDPVAALEAFKGGRIDHVELDLGLWRRGCGSRRGAVAVLDR